MTKKLFLMSALVAALLMGVCSCSKDDNKKDSRTLNINVAMLNHVVTNGQLAEPFKSSYTLKLNRTDNYVDLSGVVRLSNDGPLYEFTISNIPATHNATRDYYTFSIDRAIPSAGNLSGVVTNLSGVIDYNNRIISVTYTINGQTTVNATLSSLYYQNTSTNATDASGVSFNIDNAAYEFAIDHKTLTAKLGIYDVRFSKSMALISKLEYENLKVEATATGYKITGANLAPTNTGDAGIIKNFPLTSIEANLNLAGGTIMATYVTNGYTVTTTGSCLMK